MIHSTGTFICVVLLCAFVQMNICGTTNISATETVIDLILPNEITTKDVGRIDKDCNCGDGSTGCKLHEGKRLCTCKDGHKQDMDGICRECNCGVHGNCSFEEVSGFLRKECECFSGFVEFGGLCKECSCGINGNCTLNHREDKICKCDFGYGPVYGFCSPCGCYPEQKCNFDKFSRRCQCSEGYGDVQGLCKDINECLNPDICPDTSKCVNLLGSYDCQCRDGFKWPSGPFNPKKDECEDIDECLTMDMPCLYESTLCFNIPGSYRCDCKEGFQPLLTPIDPNQSPKYSDCIEDTSTSKTIAIVVGCICGAIIIALLILVQYRGRR